MVERDSIQPRASSSRVPRVSTFGHGYSEVETVQKPSKQLKPKQTGPTVDVDGEQIRAPRHPVLFRATNLCEQKDLGFSEVFGLNHILKDLGFASKSAQANKAACAAKLKHWLDHCSCKCVRYLVHVLI